MKFIKECFTDAFRLWKEFLIALGLILIINICFNITDNFIAIVIDFVVIFAVLFVSGFVRMKKKDKKEG